MVYKNINKLMSLMLIVTTASLFLICVSAASETQIGKFNLNKFNILTYFLIVNGNNSTINKVNQ